MHFSIEKSKVLSVRKENQHNKFTINNEAVDGSGYEREASYYSLLSWPRKTIYRLVIKEIWFLDLFLGVFKAETPK